MTEKDAPESNEGDNEDAAEAVSATTEENWEANWYDYGSLPDTVPEFNVALTKFLVKQAGVNETFPAIL
jgi:hypothetical protein